MDKLAGIACMSSYHWHRIYRAIYGETLAATVKRLRLHRAAGDIVRTDLSVGEIAKRSGYPDLQSFNRIYKSVYGMPPGQYRKEGSHKAFEPSPNGKTAAMFDVPDGRLSQFNCSDCRTPARLFGTLYARGLAKPTMRMIGVYLDDPDMPPTELLTDIYMPLA